MKPVFGINVTDNNNNESMNADYFAAVKATSERRDALDAAADKAAETLNKSKIPVPFVILKILSLICGGFFILSFLNTMSETGFKKAVLTTPISVVIGIAGIALFVIISIIENLHEKNVLKGDAANEIVSEIEDLTRDIYKELGVPQSAKNTDVLLFKYKVLDDGSVAPRSSALSLTPYINFECKAFVRDGILSLSDLEQRYDFPISEMRAIVKVDKRICVPTWNKSVPYNSEEYKKYKLTKNNVDCIFFKPYYVLELVRDDEIYGIYFPSYELEVFEALTGIHAAND